MRVGKIGGLEVDFLVETSNGMEYYQVAASVRDSSTLERELAPFGKIRDNHPKFLLTLDEDPPRQHRRHTQAQRAGLAASGQAEIAFIS